MYADLYYMLTAFSFVFFFFAVIFTWDEMIKVDALGREYDATFFIVVPFCIVGMILHVILAYQSWNIETLYVVGNSVETYVNTDLNYFLPVHVFFFFVHFALLFYNAFEFFIVAAAKVEGKKRPEDRLW